MKDVIYVTGHKNPDTDSICSAIAYAEFKNKTGDIPALPIRLGELNRETEFILNYFGIEPPQLIETVKTQVSDLKIDNTAPISPDISIKMAWSIMKKHNVKTLPVVDGDDRLLGIASLSNVTSVYMDMWDNYILAKSNTKLDNILDTLSAKYIYVHDENLKIDGKIIIAAMLPNSAKMILESGDVVICGDRDDAQAAAIECGASLMIVSGNHVVSDKVINKAKVQGCSIISTPYDSFTSARLIIQSIPVRYVMSKDNIVSFSTDDFVEEIKDVMLETRYRSYPVIDDQSKVIGSISRYHLISKNRKKVILVDHNEKTQSVHGLQDAEILEIIDHHRIADVQTGLPIYFRNEPVGSTATIVSSIFFENGIIPSKKIAGILVSAIISDTLVLRSPTTTLVDKLMLRRLAEIAEINIDEYSKEMFKAGTSLKGRTVTEIFNQDFKAFSIDDLKIGVAQVTTMDLESFLDIKDSMLKHMNSKCEADGFNSLVLLITDILNSASEVLVVGKEKELIGKALNITLDEQGSGFAPGVVSRKKQVIPPITSAILSRNKK